MSEALTEYLASFADELAAKFRRVERLVNHAPTAGNYHEAILRAVLRNFMSRRFSIRTGFVFKADNAVSPQIDILVIDEDSPAAYLFQDGDFCIASPSAVVASIEVKTHMRVADFDSALRGAAALRRLYDDNSVLPYTAVFAYTSTVSEASLAKWFLRSPAVDLKDTPQYAPDMFVLFGDRLLLGNTNEHFALAPAGRFRLFANLGQVKQWDGAEEGSGWQLRTLLASIYGQCLKRTIVPGSLEATRQTTELNQIRTMMTWSGAVPKADYYQLGVGHVGVRS